jgi:hypothetical protein
MLSSLVSTAKQQNGVFACPPKIHAIARTDVDSKLRHSASHGLAIAEQAALQPPDTQQDRRRSATVAHCIQPISERVASGWSDVMEYLEFGHCSLLATITQAPIGRCCVNSSLPVDIVVSAK